MRTISRKYSAEQNEEDYEIYVSRCADSNQEPMDIYEWLAMEQETAEEERNDYRRDEGFNDDT